MPQVGDLRREILQEAYSSKFSFHPSGIKMYRDMRQLDISHFVVQCLTCQQVKVEHQYLAWPLHPLPLPKWKWEHITMDLVFRLPKSLGGNNVVWIIVDRLKT